MAIDKLIIGAIKGYNGYLYCCDLVAKEARKYIDWDDSVSCKYVPGTGLSILATIPNNCGISGMPECVCPANSFFPFVESKDTLLHKNLKK